MGARVIVNIITAVISTPGSHAVSLTPKWNQYCNTPSTKINMDDITKCNESNKSREKEGF